MSIGAVEHNALLYLARGSSCAPAAHVAAVCREVAQKLHAAGFSGNLSRAVYSKALRQLTGAYRPNMAASYDRAQLPDGDPPIE